MSVGRTLLVVSLAWQWLGVSLPSLRAEQWLDMTYDEATGVLSTVPTPRYLRLVSRGGQFINYPTARVWQFHESLVESDQPDAPDPMVIGPVLPPGLTTSQLKADLCVQVDYATPIQLQNPFGGVRLNGEVLQSAPQWCDYVPKKFPPLTGEQVASLMYNSVTGEIAVQAQTPITTLTLMSQSRQFTGNANPTSLVGTFDVNTPAKLFKLVPAGFAGVDLGPVAPAGMSSHAFLEDVCYTGTWKPGGWVTNLEYLYPNGGAALMRNCDAAPPTGGELDVAMELSTGTVTVSANDLSVEENAAGGALAALPKLLMTNVEIRSKSGLLAGVVGESDGVSTHYRIVAHDEDGLANVEFQIDTSTGVDQSFLQDDLEFDVTFLRPTKLENVSIYNVPEPNHWLPLLGCLAVRWRRGQSFRVSPTQLV